MRRINYTGGMLIATIAGYAGTASAQQNCDSEIQQLRGQLEQGQVRDELRSEIEQLLAQAETGENCQNSVAAAQRLMTASEQQSSSQQRSDPQQQAQQPQAQAQQQQAQAQQPQQSQSQSELSQPQQSQQAQSAQNDPSDAPSFEETDQNSDGQISREELARIPGIEFTAADANGDRMVSRMEYQQAAQEYERTAQRSSQSEASSALSAQRQQSRDDTTDIDVQQPAADVDVQTPAPQVNVEQQPTQVTVEQQPPDVRITQPEPNVTVSQQEPEVTVEQAEPEVQVSQSEPEVRVSQAEPEVDVVRPEADEGSVQAQAQADVQQTRGATISEEDALDLVGETIETRDGEEIGDVAEIVQSRTDDQYYAVADVGGFLGIGAEQKAIPFDQLEFDAQRNLVSLISREQLEQMQSYDEQQYMAVEAGGGQASGSSIPAFEEVDADADGQLSGSELALVEGVDFSEADQDQDGAVSRDEYEQLSSQ